VVLGDWQLLEVRWDGSPRSFSIWLSRDPSYAIAFNYPGATWLQDPYPHLPEEQLARSAPVEC